MKLPLYSYPMDGFGSYPHGTKAHHECVPGFYLASGDYIRMCVKNGGSVVGVWSGEEPVCEGELFESN